jgi:hypothetical protein
MTFSLKNLLPRCSLRKVEFDDLKATVDVSELASLEIRSKPRDLQFSFLLTALLELFFDRVVMGLRPTQGDENSGYSAAAPSIPR